ncbi:triosephosphate isomerase [Patescibacteria group bacterium]|nr:triosephosphate isomerase [Patescibacteria group bacterium]
MKMTSREMLEWFDNWNELKKNFEGTGIEVILAPSSIHIPLLASLTGDSIRLSSQDASPNRKGAHTGDIGAFQIKEFCKYAILGHSERREPPEIVTEKRDRCLETGLIPIICFINPKNANHYYIEGCILAWEDPQNISQEGVYREKPEDEIRAGAKEIRTLLPKEAPVIYGGSVNRQNVKSIVNINELNGVLVGNASLEPRHFLDIIRTYEFKPKIHKT